MFRQIRNAFGATELRFQISKIKSPNQKEGFKEVLRELKAELVTNLLVQVPFSSSWYSQVFLCNLQPFKIRLDSDCFMYGKQTADNRFSSERSKTVNVILGMKISNGFLFSVEDNPQKQWFFTLQLNGISGNLHNWVLDFESDLHEFSIVC